MSLSSTSISAGIGRALRGVIGTLVFGRIEKRCLRLWNTWLKLSLPGGIGKTGRHVLSHPVSTHRDTLASKMRGCRPFATQKSPDFRRGLFTNLMFSTNYAGQLGLGLLSVLTHCASFAWSAVIALMIVVRVACNAVSCCWA